MRETYFAVALIAFLLILVGTVSCSSSLRDATEEYSQEQVLVKNMVQSVRHIVEIRPATNMPYYCAFISSPPGSEPLAMVNMLGLTQRTMIIINTWPDSKRNYTVPKHRNCSGCENIIIFASMTDIHEVISEVNVPCTGARIELLVAIYDPIDSDGEGKKSAQTVVDFAWKQLRGHAIVLVTVGSRVLVLKSERHKADVRCEPEPPRIMSYWEAGTFVGNLSFKRFDYNKCVVRVATANCWRYTKVEMSNGKESIVGIEGQILETIAEKQNYTVELINAVPPIIEHPESTDFKIGLFNLTCVQSKLKSNEADIGVCSMLISYDEEMKYCISYAASTIVLMIPIPKYIPFTSILHTFSTPVWICVMVGWIVGRILIRLNRKSISSLMALALFLGVSVAPKSRGFVEKWQMTLWVVYGYVITQSYIASLASVLNNPPVPKIKTIEELVVSDIRVAGLPYLKNSFVIDDKYKRIVETYIDVTVDENSLMMLNPGKIFQDVQRTGILVDYLLLMKYGQLPHYYRLQQDIVRYPLGMAVMARSRVSLTEIDRTIASLIENGLIHKWLLENMLPPASRRMHTDIEAPSPTLSLEEVAGIFVILAAGLPISIIVFIFEVYIKIPSKNNSTVKNSRN